MRSIARSWQPRYGHASDAQGSTIAVVRAYAPASIGDEMHARKLYTIAIVILAGGCTVDLEALRDRARADAASPDAAGSSEHDRTTGADARASTHAPVDTGVPTAGHRKPDSGVHPDGNAPPMPVDCEPGYAPDAFDECVDINECDGANPCGMEECVNSPGSYACGACDPGYAQDSSGVCTDIDECDLGTHSCHENASCTNSPGSYACACLEGYTGSGTQCADLDECAEDEDNCDDDPDACVNRTPDQGYFECECPEGFDGDGVGGDGCANINECQEGTHTCDQDPPTQCMDTVGGFECGPCGEGFVGNAKDGTTGCIPTLRDLDVRGLTLAFDPTVLQYSIAAPFGQRATHITAVGPSTHELRLDERQIESGVAIEAPLQLGENVFEARVSAGGAERVYELTVSRTGASAAYLKSSTPSTDDRFGTAVSLSADGSTLAVSSPYADAPGGGTSGDLLDSAGAVYVFVRSGKTWMGPEVLRASNPDSGDLFGEAMAISADGSVLAVGARQEGSSSPGIDGTPNDDTPGAGAVYVFTRTKGEWSSPVYIKPPEPEAGSYFGNALAISDDGNTLAVGAFAAGRQTKGAAFVFHRSAGTWSSQPDILVAPHESTSESFGMAVALDGEGNTLAVGDSSETSLSSGINGELQTGGERVGAVYVYTSSGSAWGTPDYIKAFNAESGDHFGRSVALSTAGDTLAVGAPTEASSSRGVNTTPNNDDPNAGAIYVFRRTAGEWGASQDYLKPPEGSSNSDRFGESIALANDGSLLVTGARYATQALTGVVYAFTRHGSSWNYPPDQLRPSSLDTNDQFGRAVSVSEDGLFIAGGAHGDDSSLGDTSLSPDEAASSAGAAYVLH